MTEDWSIAIMTKKIFLPLLLLGLGVMTINAQKSVALSISPAETIIPNDELCVELRIKAIDEELKLSSMSYRLYYDASGMRFLRLRTRTTLPSETFAPPKIIQAQHNADASGYGSLEFDRNIGFVNLVIQQREGNTALLLSQEWLTSTTLCFEPLEGPRQVVWARHPLTSGYATAFSSVAYLENNELKEAHIVEYIDYSDKLKIQDIITQSEKRY